MTQTRIVTHCLAVWHTYSGQLNQQEKDFFDGQVPFVAGADEFQAVHELIAERLKSDISVEEATAIAFQLVSAYAAGWGQEILPPQKLMH